MKPTTCHMQRATWGRVNRYHCDIKTENALVAKDLVSGTFCVKLCDFTRLCHSVCPSLPPSPYAEYPIVPNRNAFPLR